MGDCNPEKSLSRKIDCYCHWDLEEERQRKLAKKILNAKLCINFSQYVLLYGVKGILHTIINFPEARNIYFVYDKEIQEQHIFKIIHRERMLCLTRYYRDLFSQKCKRI